MFETRYFEKYELNELNECEITKAISSLQADFVGGLVLQKL